MSELPGGAAGPEGPASELLPLFPLSAVLFPGAPLPLHIFEQRYRDLVRDLVEQPGVASRRFGVIAIRSGREAGPVLPDLHAIGCATEIRSLSAYPDGRYDLVSIGVRRFRLLGVDPASRPYLMGLVEWLPEPTGDRAPGLLDTG